MQLSSKKKFLNLLNIFQNCQATGSDGQVYNDIGNAHDIRLRIYN